MKRTAVLVSMMMLLVAPAFATYTSDINQYYGQSVQIRDVNNNLQIRFDYTGTTSGIPIYVGYAIRGRAAADDSWRVYKFTDSAAGPTLRQVADGVWNDRATLTYS